MPRPCPCDSFELKVITFIVHKKRLYIFVEIVLFFISIIGTLSFRCFACKCRHKISLPQLFSNVFIYNVCPAFNCKLGGGIGYEVSMCHGVRAHILIVMFVCYGWLCLVVCRYKHNNITIKIWTHACWFLPLLYIIIYIIIYSRISCPVFSDRVVCAHPLIVMFVCYGGLSGDVRYKHNNITIGIWTHACWLFAVEFHVQTFGWVLCVRIALFVYICLLWLLVP